jgi:hypothetical protein
MTPARVVPDLLTPLATAASLGEGLGLTLRRLVRLTGASAGALSFRPPRGEPIAVTVGAPDGADGALRALVSEPAAGARRAAGLLGRGRRERTAVRRLALGAPPRPVGALALVGRPRTLRRVALPGGFGREL